MRPVAESFFGAHKEKLLPFIQRYRATLLIDFSEQGFINSADARRSAAMEAYKIFPILVELLPAWEVHVAASV